MTSRIRYTFALLNSKGVEFCMSGRSALLRISGELSVRSVKQMYARAKLKLQ